MPYIFHVVIVLKVFQKLIHLGHVIRIINGAGGLRNIGDIGRSKTIYPNVSLGGISLSGMTVTEAEVALLKGGWTPQDNSEVTVILPGDYSFRVTGEDAGLTLDSHAAADAALRYGHSGKHFADMKAYLKCITGKVSDADILSAASAEGILSVIDDALKEYGAMLDKGYTLDTEKAELRLIKGGSSVRPDADELCGMILQAFADKKTEVRYEAKPDASGTAPDFDKIHSEVFSEAVNASYDKENHTATQSSTGVDFDVAAAKAA